nr:ion channel DMI1 isoform X1 [Ipomoea batatas]
MLRNTPHKYALWCVSLYFIVVCFLTLSGVFRNIECITMKGNEMLPSRSGTYLYNSTLILFKPIEFFENAMELLQPKWRSCELKPSVEPENAFAKFLSQKLTLLFSWNPSLCFLIQVFTTTFKIAFLSIILGSDSDISFLNFNILMWCLVAAGRWHRWSFSLRPFITSFSISLVVWEIYIPCVCIESLHIIGKHDSHIIGKSFCIEIENTWTLGLSPSISANLVMLVSAYVSLDFGVVMLSIARSQNNKEHPVPLFEWDVVETESIPNSIEHLLYAISEKVSVSKARAIIVLASDENADQSDARALRVVLSLTGVKEGLKGHVVVEMSDLDNEPLVKLVGGDLIETVVAHDVIGRLMIQCALQPGLAQIWEDILGFENAEFYIKRWPQLDGLCFRDVLISFPDAIPCGVKDAADGGKIIINPDDSYVLKEGDKILVIAEDDDTYAPAPLPEVHRGVFPRMTDPPKFPEKILFCGWRRDIDDMIMVLEALLAPGSELWMFNEVIEKDRERKLTDGGLDITQLVNIKLIHREGNAVIRRHLENLPLETFDSILILADESLEDSIVHSDSRSLATLLLIRDIQSKRLPYKNSKSVPLRHSAFSQSSWIREMQQASDKSIIISEILDSRTRNLVSVSRISDYVLSNELVSMALAMVAEDKQINRVLEELFAEEGNELCIKPAEFYLYDQEELCFFDIMVRGRQRREIVIGYRLAATERAVMNPANKLEPHKWSIDDVFVVISSGE